MANYNAYHEAHAARQREIAKRDAAVSGVEIFKVGRHKAMNGETLNYLDRDLQEIADGYNAADHPAPIVIGHPQTDAPAYGWVTGLSVKGDKLVADVGDIEPEFSALVKAKRYRKVSASFWKPTAPSNPNPGKWTLKHVGFLGATAPAVPGLKDAEFGDTGSDTVAFGEDDIADLPAEHLATIARHHHEVALEKLISDGKLLPRHKASVLDFVCALDDGSAVSFSDGQTQGKSEWLLDFLAAQPQQVQFGAIDLGDKPFPNSTRRQDLPSGFTVDPERQSLADAASAMAEDEGISFSDAVRKLGG